MIACDPKYLHRPLYPDKSTWPWDTPSIEVELKRKGLTLANAGSLQSSEVFAPTGQRWMLRAFNAERILRDSIKSTELLIAMYEKKISELRKLREIFDV